VKLEGRVTALTLAPAGLYRVDYPESTAGDINVDIYPVAVLVAVEGENVYGDPCTELLALTWGSTRCAGGHRRTDTT
jgi:hypothetical protein